ncbi:oligopeptide ABC transporter permease [Sutcliffiella cohnii]|uniref:Peptide ABC transporter permease n=1 Tax=Sutcliffiella cohnii TaxID=33932 RepID=A0A223KM91_9BACI|nr:MULTISPECIES: oligopeptide ABC transporter permease [Sutcliffiella]AST90601.1 peptide ABC transporter permease [Sutcliffiella cohnii]MED4016890.1 ABC transporter permease [Sutcliffiella cohnii]WBL16254.1 ABC transporter permease [Sutcliffiella sp. NC1]
MKNNYENLNKDLFQPAAIDPNSSEKITKPSLNYWQTAWIRLKKNKAAIFGVFIIIVIGFLALFGPFMNEYTFKEQDLTRSNLPPKIPVIENLGILDGTKNGVDMYEARGVEDYFWFGTDALGRDLWTRVWTGTRISIYIALLAAVIDMIVGVAYGGISAFYGGRVDNVMQRIIEVLVGIPNLVIVILMILVMEPGIIAITIALTITGWVGMARVVRGQILKLKGQEFVLASKTLGSTNNRIISKHLLPNVVGVIIINTMFTIPSAIFFEAFLSFIGLGLQAPMASLGTLIDDGFKSLQIFPHIMIFPAIIISLLMIAFNLVADGMRDALDPKMKD